MIQHGDRGRGPGGDLDPTGVSAPPAPSGTSADLREVLRTRELCDADLVNLLCDDQAVRWSANQRVPAEAYRALHPSLQRDGEAAFELVYSEFLLRESLGESPTAEEF